MLCFFIPLRILTGVYKLESVYTKEVWELYTLKNESWPVVNLNKFCDQEIYRNLNMDRAYLTKTESLKFLQI